MRGAWESSNSLGHESVRDVRVNQREQVGALGERTLQFMVESQDSRSLSLLAAE